MRVPILILICLVFSTESKSQTIGGKVTDSLSGQAIPFVNISLDDEIHGTTSDIDGRFRLVIPEGYRGAVTFSHISYRPQKKTLSAFLVSSVVMMVPATTLLRELVILARENPAFRIIRKVIEHKKDNSPDELKSYMYVAYNKFLVTTSEPDHNSDSIIHTLQNRPDTFKLSSKQKKLLKFDSIAKKSHFFLSESVSEKKVINPNKQKETLMALQISGYKSPIFASLGASYQAFSFYKDNINLLGKDYLNPISRGSFRHYDFELADTSYLKSDTVFTIRFEPKPHTYFNGLKGVISIITDGYAIKNVVASVSDSLAMTSFGIMQNYEKTNGHWFPIQINTDMDLHHYKVYGRTLLIRQRSYLRDIAINPELRDQEFGDIKVELNTPPSKKINSELLDKYRPGPIDSKDQNAYRMMDSIMRKKAWLDKGIEAMVTESLPVGPVSFDLNKFMLINRHEKIRLGVGLHTNDLFSKKIRLGGYYGYGIRDQQAKYGGDIQFNFNLDKDFYLRFQYDNTLYETGSTHSQTKGQFSGSASYRLWVSDRYDHTEGYRMEWGYRVLPDVHVSLFASHNLITPAYVYQALINGELKSRFGISETGIQLRYVHKEDYLRLRGAKIFFSQSFPVITFSAIRALNLFSTPDWSYYRFDLSIKHEIKYHVLGKTRFYLTAGYIDGYAPYGRLYNGRGSRATSIVVNDFFQTMGLYEFTGTQYAGLFISHNFGNVITHRKFSKPELVIYQHVGIGSLHHPEIHQGLVLQGMDKGYLESGIGLNNIVRFNYINVGYFGLGASAFYRYGPYQFAKPEDNLVFRINNTFTF